MKNKLFASVLSIGLASLIFCSCGVATSQGVDGMATVHELLATEKYMQDAKIDLTSEAELNFVGIKNETQSAQLMLTAQTKITSFDLKTADLTSTNGSAKIAKENFKVFAERYIEIYDPFLQNESYLANAGFYPDALVPIEKYKISKEDRIEKGENQGLWIDANIPLEAEAGDYSGKFTLSVNGKDKEIPVALKVYNLIMPNEVHSPSAFDIWYEKIAYGEGDNMDSGTYQRYYEFLWSKRLNCETLPPAYTKSMEAFLDYIEVIADNPKVTAYRIPLIPYVEIVQEKISPKIEGTYTKEEIQAEKDSIKNALKSQLKQILDRNLYLRANGKENIDLCKKALYYYEDEPTVGQRANCVKIFCELLNTAKKELTVEYSEQFKANPDLLASFNNIDEICPSNYVNDSLTVSLNKDGTPNYEKSDGLTFWCPEMYQFDKTGFRENVAKRQEYGEKVWWYLCVSNSPHPSYYVESIPMNIRLQSWMQYDYNIGGILYWQVAQNSADRDAYEDIIYSGFGGGEGILVYPGVKYGMKDPISSIRLEQIRLGQQDYELFYMLNEYLAKAKTDKTANDVINSLGKKLYNGTTISEVATEKLFEDARITVLEILKEFQANNVSAALALINKI